MKYPNLKGFFRGFSGTALSSNSFTPPGLVEKMFKIGFGEMVLSCFRRWSDGNSVFALDLYTDTNVHTHNYVYIFMHNI